MSAAVSRTTSPAGVDHVSATMPSAPAFETAAASSGTADIGAWTIGCSIPSSSQTGVRTDYHLPCRSGSRDRATSPERTRLARAGGSTCSYDSYDVGIDWAARLFHP